MKRLLFFLSLFALGSTAICHADTNPYAKILAVWKISTNIRIEIGMKRDVVVNAIGEPQEIQRGKDGFYMMKWDEGVLLYIDSSEKVEKIVVSGKQYISFNGLMVGDPRGKIIEKMGKIFDEWKEWISFDLVYGAWLMQFKMRDGLIEEIHICRAGD